MITDYLSIENPFHPGSAYFSGRFWEYAQLLWNVYDRGVDRITVVPSEKDNLPESRTLPVCPSSIHRKPDDWQDMMYARHREGVCIAVNSAVFNQHSADFRYRLSTCTFPPYGSTMQPYAMHNRDNPCLGTDSYKLRSASHSRQSMYHHHIAACLPNLCTICRTFKYLFVEPVEQLLHIFLMQFYSFVRIRWTYVFHPQFPSEIEAGENFLTHFFSLLRLTYTAQALDCSITIVFHCTSTWSVQDPTILHQTTRRRRTPVNPHSLLLSQASSPIWKTGTDRKSIHKTNR